MPGGRISRIKAYGSWDCRGGSFGKRMRIEVVIVFHQGARGYIEVEADDTLWISATTHILPDLH
jgi:hypothetical protein